MGGMQTWLWAQKYPDFIDVAVPMASLPTEMSGRNWMMRRMIIDAIRNDPGVDERQLHEAAAQPAARLWCSTASRTNGGNQGLYQAGAHAREGRPNCSTSA